MAGGGKEELAKSPMAPASLATVAVAASRARTTEHEKLRIFISYSREDLEFADQLLIGLEIAGFAPTIDRHGISGGEEWKQRLGNLIRETETVVFVISPASAMSEVCAWEVAEAARLGQRIIPIVCRTLNGASPPQQLSDLNYIYFYPEPKSPGSGFAAGLRRLAQALNIDIEWHREHTRILLRATEWDIGARQPARLLSGGDVQAAKEWAARRPPTAPELTDLQQAFIRASEEEAEARNNAERRRLAEIAAAQDARARALSDAEAALRKAADAQRRRSVLRNLLLVVMSVAAGISAWSWYTISEGNKELARQVRLAEVAASRARQAQKQAQDAEFNAIVNECTASEQLLVASPTTAENLHNYMSCSSRFAYALIRRGQPEDAKRFLGRARNAIATAGSSQEDQTRAFFGLLIKQAATVADCAAAAPASVPRVEALGRLITAATALVSFSPPPSLEQRWREDIFRGFLYLSNFSTEEREYDKAYKYALGLVERLAKVNADKSAGARDLARALDHLAWTALLTKRFDKALGVSQKAIQIADERKLGDLKSIRLNYAHALLFNDRAGDARREYQEFLTADLVDDIKTLKAAGLCEGLFVELVGTPGRCVETEP